MGQFTLDPNVIGSNFLGAMWFGSIYLGPNALGQTPWTLLQCTPGIRNILGAGFGDITQWIENQKVIARKNWELNFAAEKNDGAVAAAV